MFQIKRILLKNTYILKFITSFIFFFVSVEKNNNFFSYFLKKNNCRLNNFCIFAPFFKNIKNKKIIAIKNKMETYNKYTARIGIERVGCGI